MTDMCWRQGSQVVGTLELPLSMKVSHVPSMPLSFPTASVISESQAFTTVHHELSVLPELGSRGDTLVTE